MSGIGIGDAIAITEIIVKIVKVVKDTPKEIVQIAEHVKDTKETLSFLSKTIGQPGSLSHSRAEGMKSHLKHRMSELERDLRSTRKLVEEWKDICEKKNYGQKIKFIMVDAGKLKDLDLKLRNHDVQINSILQKLQSANDDKMIGQNDKVIEKLQEMEAEQAKRWKKWEEVVKKQGIGAVYQAASCNDAEPWLLIKKDLMNQGLSKGDAEEILNPIRSRLSNIQTPPPEDDKSISFVLPIQPVTPNEPKDQNLNLSPAPPGTPSPKPNLIRATAKTKAQDIEVNKSRILFIDDSNSRRSIVAQAYFELARIWTINTTNRWLFEEVDSAGIYIESPFTIRHREKLKYGADPTHWKPVEKQPKNPSLQSLIDQNTFRSNERSAVVKRLRERKTQGIYPSYFWDWDYIISFGNDTRDALQTLRLCAIGEQVKDSTSPKAKLLTLRGAPYTLEGQEMVNAVKKAIKAWLKDELGWQEPPPTVDLRWSLRRTYQVVTTEKHFRIMMGENWSQGFSVVRRECAVFLTCTPERWDGTRLISCAGKRGEIDKAWAMLKEKGIVEIARD